MFKKIYLFLAVAVPTLSSERISHELLWEIGKQAIMTLPDDLVVAVIKESSCEEAYFAAMECQTERCVINHLLKALNEIRTTLDNQQDYSSLSKIFKELAQKLDEHQSIKQTGNDAVRQDYLIFAMTDCMIDTFLNIFKTMPKEQQQNIINEFLSSLDKSRDSRPAGFSEILQHINFFHVDSDNETLARYIEDRSGFGVPSIHVLRRDVLYHVLVMRACLHENISSEVLYDVVRANFKDYGVGYTHIRNFVRYYLLGDEAPEFYYWPKPMAINA